MKNLFLLLFALVQLTAHGNTAAALTSSATYPDFTHCTTTSLLPAGTLILMETTEKNHSRALTEGQVLHFKVKANVVVNGKVVITTGALALGKVKTIQKATFNNPEEVTIEVDYVQTVDGQMIGLTGNEQTFKGKYPNQGMSLKPGQAITARITNSTYIN